MITFINILTVLISFMPAIILWLTDSEILEEWIKKLQENIK